MIGLKENFDVDVICFRRRNGGSNAIILNLYTQYNRSQKNREM